jgi:predicted component of type VI protein secretion system
MHVQVNTHNSINGDQRLESLVASTIEDNLSHFENRITRVEVHLKDANSHKGGAGDKHCTMEARIKGHQPVAVNHHAAALDEAYEGAAVKLARSIGNTIGRMNRGH